MELRSWLRPAFVLACAFVLAACDSGSEAESSEALRNQFAVTIAGSVGDGPAVGADVVILDADGNVVVGGVSDSTAGYRIEVPPGTKYPLRIKAVAGTDLVSGQPLDFELEAAVTDPSQERINISPISTLAVRMAECSGASVSASDLDEMFATIGDHVGMGLDPTVVDQPMNDVVDASNAASIVLANEGLGEALRRTSQALQASSSAVDVDRLVDMLACDLVDGAIDGTGGDSNTRVAAAFQAAVGAVSLEMMAGHLHVNGVDATSAMDDAIASILPETSAPPSVTDLAITPEFIEQTRDALAIVADSESDDTVVKYVMLLDGTTPSDAGAQVATTLDAADMVTMQGLSERMALADDSVLEQTAGAARTVESALPASLSFDAAPTDIASGETALLTWASGAAKQCFASDGWSGKKDLSGNFTTPGLAASTDYTLKCTGLGGTSRKTVRVTVNGAPPAPNAPTVDLTASNASVIQGQATTLSWATTNATACTASGGWIGSKPTVGSGSSGAVNATTTFTLTCTGAGGSSSDSVTVTTQPIPAPTLSFNASPTSVASNGNSQLSWTSSNATSCTASGAWSGNRATFGSASVGPLSTNSTYTLTCNGSGGSVSRNVTVTVAAAPAPTLTLTASPTSVASGATSTLTWTSTNATSCTASGGWTGARGASGSETTAALTANATYTLACAGSGGSVTRSATVTVASAPTVSLSASPSSIASGGSATLTWSSTNASACSASGAWSGNKATSGSQSTGTRTADGTFTLTCTGTGGSASQSATVTIAAAPTVSLSASPTSIASGGASTLTWSSTNATSCTASGAWSGTKGTSGSQSTGALTANATYTLTCTGTGGSTAQTTTVSIAGAPAVSLAASPGTVASGGSSTLTWSSTNATSCTASGAWSGSKGTSGTQSTGALTSNGTYTLTCSGTGGSASQSATVSIAPAPTVAISASPATVASGGSSTLTWSSANATSCTASGAWSGSKATSGTQSTGAVTANGTYTLTCTGTGGSASQSATVTVTAAPTVSLSASPTSVASGASSTLTWSSANATSCTASGAWAGAKATLGTQSTGALTSAATYTLSCSGTGGSTTQSVTVGVNAPQPTVTITASPSSIASGASSTLSWSSTNATSCTASGAWSGTKATSGTQSTGALAANATYTLSCTGGGGSGSASTTVTVAAAPSVTLSASPPGVAPNGSSTLTWSSTGVTSCTASGGWSGARATSGSVSVGPIAQDTTFSLNCTGANGSAMAMTTVSVRTARLSWTAPTQNVDGSALTDLAGFKVYYGTASRSYNQSVTINSATTTQWTLSLTPGTWFFAVTALDTAGNESAQSSEVSKTVN